MVKRFHLPEEETGLSFLEGLSEWGSVLEQPSTRERCTYFDTFDCLLGRAGYVLSKTRKGWHLIEQKTGKTVARHPLGPSRACLPGVFLMRRLPDA